MLNGDRAGRREGPIFSESGSTFLHVAPLKPHSNLKMYRQFPLVSKEQKCGIGDFENRNLRDRGDVQVALVPVLCFLTHSPLGHCMPREAIGAMSWSGWEGVWKLTSVRALKELSGRIIHSSRCK